MSMETNPPRQHGERSLDSMDGYTRRTVVAATLGPDTRERDIDRPDHASRPDLAKYSFAFRGNSKMPWETDILHMMIMWDVMAAVRPKRIVEIGAFQGASACLWIEALNRGLCEEVHLFEIKPTPALLKVISMAERPERVVLHRQPYYDFPIEADYLFIDADHGWPALADLAAALSQQCPVIAMHDTTGFLKVPLADCWGSWMAANILRQAKGYLVYEDNEKRAGAFTHRGMMIAKKEDQS